MSLIQNLVALLRIHRRTQIDILREAQRTHLMPLSGRCQWHFLRHVLLHEVFGFCLAHWLRILQSNDVRRLLFPPTVRMLISLIFLGGRHEQEVAEAALAQRVQHFALEGGFPRVVRRLDLDLDCLSGGCLRLRNWLLLHLL